MVKIIWTTILLQSVASTAFAQGMPPGCSALVTIQSQGCTVRQVFTCESDEGRLRWVALHGPKGPINLMAFDENSMPVLVMPGPGKPKGKLSDKGNGIDLAAVLAGKVDEYLYQLDFDNGNILRASGGLLLTRKIVEIDGRSLQELQRIEVILKSDNTQSPETDTSVLYDAELGLALIATTKDRATKEVKADRTPVDFIFPGEENANSFVPLYGCGE